MKRVFLLIVAPALLVALGFAQTPAASGNTDQINIKGCLGGSAGNYTITEDNTGQIFKLTTSSVDLKPHLGHDVKLIGHKASGAVGSGAAENSFAVTELNMISEHCTAVAAAPAAVPNATVSPSPETVTVPAAAAVAPAATISTPAETAVTPAAAATPPAETAVTPTATATPPAETVVTPATAATPPAETEITPTTAEPAATVSTPSENAGTPAAAAAHPARLPVRPRKPSATPAAPAITPPVTASSSPETVPTPAPVATTPTPAPARSWSAWLLLPFAVLVVVIGTLAPFLSRWRKRRLLEQTGAQNLSFTHEAISDPDKSDKSDEPVLPKAA